MATTSEMTKWTMSWISVSMSWSKEMFFNALFSASTVGTESVGKMSNCIIVAVWQIWIKISVMGIS